jgi:tripartite-type tricarboxylate transporter receptor subunit TctC
VVKARLAAIALAAIAITSNLHAEPYPDRPIRIIVPVDAGGSLDIITRSVAAGLGQELGQPVMVENRPGASQLIGVQALLRSAADGYTLLAISNTTVTAPSLTKGAQYDPAKDFAGIGLVALVPAVLVVSPSNPVADVQRFVKVAKEQAANVTGGTAGYGSFAHITAEQFFQATGMRTRLVPFKGGAPALTEVMGGRIDYFFSVIPESASLEERSVSARMNASNCSGVSLVSSATPWPAKRARRSAEATASAKAPCSLTA